MNREALQESLSAVMDNEADELELRRVLAGSENAELRSTWSRYQLARAAMHKELIVPRLDIAAGVSAALAEEPALSGGTTKSRHALSRVAVAASVTLAVLAGVRFYNQDGAALEQVAERTVPAASAAMPHVQGPAILAGYNGAASSLAQPAQAQSAWYEQRLPSYLRQHAQQAGLNEGPLPYARAASLENR
jgi:sigma-E factor negative regulatory protein RseA